MTVVCPNCSTENTRDSKFCKTCATSLTGTPDTGVTLTQTLTRPVQDLSPGALFAGRYQIIEDLGQGWQGIVQIDQMLEQVGLFGLAAQRRQHRLNLVGRDEQLDHAVDLGANSRFGQSSGFVSQALLDERLGRGRFHLFQPD